MAESTIPNNSFHPPLPVGAQPVEMLQVSTPVVSVAPIGIVNTIPQQAVGGVSLGQHQQTAVSTDHPQPQPPLQAPATTPTHADMVTSMAPNSARGETGDDASGRFNPFHAVRSALDGGSEEFAGGLNNVHYTFPINPTYPQGIRTQLIEKETARGLRNATRKPVVYLSNLQGPPLTAEQYHKLNPGQKSRYDMGIHPNQTAPKSCVSSIRSGMENQCRIDWGLDFASHSSFSRYSPINKIKLQYSAFTWAADNLGWYPQLAQQVMEATIPDRHRSQQRRGNVGGTNSPAAFASSPAGVAVSQPQVPQQPVQPPQVQQQEQPVQPPQVQQQQQPGQLPQVQQQQQQPVQPPQAQQQGLTVTGEAMAAPSTPVQQQHQTVSAGGTQTHSGYGNSHASDGTGDRETETPYTPTPARTINPSAVNRVTSNLRDSLPQSPSKRARLSTESSFDSVTTIQDSRSRQSSVAPPPGPVFGQSPSTPNRPKGSSSYRYFYVMYNNGLRQRITVAEGVHFTRNDFLEQIDDYLDPEWTYVAYFASESSKMRVVTDQSLKTIVGKAVGTGEIVMVSRLGGEEEEEELSSDTDTIVSTNTPDTKESDNTEASDASLQLQTTHHEDTIMTGTAEEPHQQTSAEPHGTGQSGTELAMPNPSLDNGIDQTLMQSTPAGIAMPAPDVNGKGKTKGAARTKKIPQMTNIPPRRVTRKAKEKDDAKAKEMEKAVEPPNAPVAPEPEVPVPTAAELKAAKKAAADKKKQEKAKKDAARDQIINLTGGVAVPEPEPIEETITIAASSRGGKGSSRGRGTGRGRGGRGGGPKGPIKATKPTKVTKRKGKASKAEIEDEEDEGEEEDETEHPDHLHEINESK
ncbi:hypothetical protein BJ508DRAFT_327760 [Ascobolus immersus RN42]|uniref:Uncharacterized protein n=1 Tax=Ascobolus immersus RN42 TaxID=1160509 RepID=A0A3N4I3X8_ASCIM|nr:hypothetical protein BJ508DRAFT_327760 [Ascobolus immersus RN42]